jgi:tripartite-type tricarboxylate transporter receptor subunit TctC
LRTLTALCAAVGALVCMPLSALADSYPKGQINLIVPLAPGDAADTAARAMAEDVSKQLNVPIVVSNRPGAGGAIGTSNVVTAKKDGYTLLFTQNSPLTIRRALEPKSITYDPLKDLAPLGLTTRTPSILVVRKDAPFKDFRALIDHAKKAPGTVRIGTAGSGSAGDVSVQIINALAGTDIASIPYRGAAPAVTDVLGGQVEGVVLGLGALSSHLKSGALKGIAISSKSSELPGVPTLTELGFQQDLQGVWLAFFAPAGIPAEVSKALVPALEHAARNPAIAAQLAPLGIVQDYAGPDKLNAEIAKEFAAITELVKKGQAQKQ